MHFLTICFSVVRSAIGDIPLCLGGEVDCVNGELSHPETKLEADIPAASPGNSSPGLEGCMELKTNKVIENEKQEAIFHKQVLIRIFESKDGPDSSSERC